MEDFKMHYSNIKVEMAPMGKDADASSVEGVTNEPHGMSPDFKKKWPFIVDDYCLVIFPILFLVFNIVYWAICLNNSPSQDSPFILSKDKIKLVD